MAEIKINLIDANTDVIALINGKFVKCKTTGEAYVCFKNGKADRISYEVNIPDEKYEGLNKSISSDSIFLTKEEAMKATGLDQF